MISLCTRRSTSNYHAHSKAYHTKANTQTPGLQVYHNFLSRADKADLQWGAVYLHRVIMHHLASTRQDRTFFSQKHNLKTKEYYRLMHINDAKLGTFSCQHFERYGEDGHKLTYFIGNKNLPKFLYKSLITKITQLPEVIAITKGQPLGWNLTFNTYNIVKNKESVLAGFDFHKDIPSNGEATMIYSLGHFSQFQIRHPGLPEKIETTDLIDNSLIVSTQEARWGCEHRVVPVKVDSYPCEDIKESIGRISIVLGFSVQEISKDKQ